MLRRVTGVVTLSLIIALLVGIPTCFGAGYPSKSIDLIVGFGQGGGTDVFTRALAPALKRELGVNVAVINMPGASSATAMNEVMKRPADGYTVFMITSDMLTNDLLGRSKYTYADLIPIVRAHVDIGLLQVSAKSPFQTWEEFVAKAKAEPGKYTIAGVGAGSFDEQAVAILMSSAGIKYRFVPYESASEMHAALLGGHVDAMYAEPSHDMNLLEAGTMKAILSFTAERVAKFKDVPCAGELGLAVPPPIWRGAAVKKGTPQEIVDRLEKAFTAALQSKEYKEFEERQALNVYPGFQGSKDFAKSMAAEYELYKKALKELGYIE